MTRRITFGAVLAASIALAAGGAPAAPAAAKTKNTHATVTVTAPARAARGARISLRVTSVFSVVANGAEHLTVFIVRPGASCPHAARRPAGADPLLSGEPADRVLIANAISDRLQQAGTWTVCAYLTYGRQITATARARVAVA